MKSIILLTAMVIGVAVPAFAQRAGGDDRVCFYKDVQFGGDAWCYAPGDELADLRNRRDEISSIRVFGRARVVVYDEREFAGASDEFDGDVPDLTLRNMEGRRNWNDRIDSFVVMREGRGRVDIFRRGRDDGDDNRGGRNRDDDDRRAVARQRVCVFENPNYQGRSQCWEAGEQELNLNRTNGWNDRISSVRVFGGAAVEVFRDAEFRGGRLQITRDIPDLGAVNWRDQISSFRVR